MKIYLKYFKKHMKSLIFFLYSQHFGLLILEYKHITLEGMIVRSIVLHSGIVATNTVLLLHVLKRTYLKHILYCR